MSEKMNDLFFEGADENAEGGHPQPEDTVSTLSWALVDEQITQDEIGLLDTLLLSDPAARNTYLDCMQLHTDLLFHFSEQQQPAAAASATKSLVIGFLSDSAMPFGVQPPNAGETRS